MTTTPSIEVDEFTKAGHERFKSTIRFKVTVHGKTKLLSWDEWMQWQATRDPLNEDPETAERVRQQIIDSRRGPGISRRR